MANVFNKIAAYFFATALIFVVLEGCCSADNIYEYYGNHGEGMIANQNQNESSSTPPTNGTTTTTNATTTTPTTTTTNATTNATTTIPTTTPTTTTTNSTTNSTTTTTRPTTTPSTTTTNSTTNSTTTTTRPTTTPSTTTTNSTTNSTTTTTRPTTSTPRPVPVNGTDEFSGNVPRNQVVAYSLELPENGLTIRLNATQGNVTGYYSFSNSQPNSTVNDGRLNSNGVTTIRKPSSRANLHQAVSQVYIGILGLDVSNQFVVTASRAEAPPGRDSAVSLHINASVTAFCIVLCTFISQFIS